MGKVMSRHLVVAKIETLMITFERRVLESERVARFIDDMIRAEDVAKRIRHGVAPGAAGIVVGTAISGTVINNLLNSEKPIEIKSKSGNSHRNKEGLARAEY